jgi:hypothetical protein
MDSFAAGQSDVVNTYLSPEFQVGVKRWAPIPESQLPIDHSILRMQSESIGTSGDDPSGASAAGCVVQETQAEGSDAEDDDDAGGSEVATDVPSEWTSSMHVHTCVVEFISILSNAVPNEDGTFTIKFVWETASAESALKFLTSKILGTQKRRGMGCYLRHLLQAFVKQLGPESVQKSFFAGLLSSRNAKALAGAQGSLDFKRHFTSAWSQLRDSISGSMNSYVNIHPVKLYHVHNTDEGDRLIPQNLLPKHGDINALARVVVLMSEPEVQELWQLIANEDRSRAACDAPEASLVQTNERLELELLTNFFNCAKYKAPHSVRLHPYSVAIAVDPTFPPNPPKSLAWLREQRRYLRVVMGACQSQFAKKTGGGERGADGADADTQFWKFCRGDAIVMFMWLHWGRGQNVPAHCSALLDESLRMDVGVASAACATPPRSTKVRKSDAVAESDFGSAMKMIGSFHDQLLSRVPSSVSSSPDATVVAAEAKARITTALSTRIQALEEAKKFVSNTAAFDKKIEALIEELLAV